jgi:hypothetical protein
MSSPEPRRRPLETPWGILSALAGVAGVIVAIIAIFVSLHTPVSGEQASDAHQNESSSPAQEATKSTTPNAEAENLPASSPPIYHIGVINPGKVDLDAPADDTHWGFFANKPVFELEVDGDYLYIHSSVHMGKTNPGYQGCKDAQNYDEHQLYLPSGDTDEYYCVQTSAGRYSLVAIKENKWNGLLRQYLVRGIATTYNQ